MDDEDRGHLAELLRALRKTDARAARTSDVPEREGRSASRNPEDASPWAGGLLIRIGCVMA
jgi:hypothetical protein